MKRGLRRDGQPAASFVRGTQHKQGRDVKLLKKKRRDRGKKTPVVEIRGLQRITGKKLTPSRSKIYLTGKKRRKERKPKGERGFYLTESGGGGDKYLEVGKTSGKMGSAIWGGAVPAFSEKT